MFLHLCYFQPKPLNNLNHVILDLRQGKVDQKKNKKHKKMYEMDWCLQDAWVVKLQWV
jgi:hypothetical protein